MNVPPSLEPSDDVPQQRRMSDAAKRRRLRAQLVQEHIAKITQLQALGGGGGGGEEETHQKVEDVADTRREVVETRGGRMCTIVDDTPCGHSAGRLKLVTGFERIEAQDEDEDDQQQKLVATKRQDTSNQLEQHQQKQSKLQQSTPAPMEATNIDKSREDHPKKAHSTARTKHAGQKIKKEVDGTTAHVPALKGPPLHQTQKRDKVPQKRLKKVAKPKERSGPQKETVGYIV